MNNKRIIGDPLKIRILFSVIVILALLNATVLGAHPILEFYVTDQVGVLSDSEIDAIEQKCKEVYIEKSPEMAVLIVNYTDIEGIKSWTANTLDVNDLGQPGKNNALLLVISISDDEWWIEVESGLKGFLTDEKVKNITDEFLVPRLAEGDYYLGIYETIDALGQEILENYTDPDLEDTSNRPIKGLRCTTSQLIFGIIILLVLVVFFSSQTLRDKVLALSGNKVPDEKLKKGRRSREDQKKKK